MRDGLPPKVRRFIAEYLKDQNGTQAAIRAGYSKRTANEQAAQLLAKLSVRSAVDAALAKIQEKAGLTQERILKALLNIAEIDPRQLFAKDGTIKKIHDITDDVAATVASIESDDKDGSVKKLKFWDKVRALELLGKHLKMFTDRNEIADGNGAPVVIQFMPANYERAKNSPSSDDKGL